MGFEACRFRRKTPRNGDDALQGHPKSAFLVKRSKTDYVGYEASHSVARGGGGSVPLDGTAVGLALGEDDPVIAAL